MVCEQGWPGLYPLQELLGCHQITIALGVREGVARPPGADSFGDLARGLDGQLLPTHLIPHLEGNRVINKVLFDAFHMSHPVMLIFFWFVVGKLFLCLTLAGVA